MSKRMITGLSIVAALAILIGLGPILIARIMDRVAERERLRVQSLKEETIIMQTERPVTAPLILQVSGKVTLMEEEGATYLILVGDAGQRYILTGTEIGELEHRAGERVMVVGRIKSPQPEEIEGKPIRFIIDVIRIE